MQTSSHFVAGPRSEATIQPMDSLGFQKAQRHSRIIHKLKFILPVIALIVIGTFLYASGVFMPSRKLQSEKFSAEVESIQLNQDSVIMINPRLVSRGETGGNYELTAKTATRRIDKPDLILLVKVLATMKKDSGGWAKLRADNGIYDKTADTLDLKTNVEMHSDQGHIIHMKTAVLNIKKGHLITENPVVVDMPNGIIRANRMEIIDNGKIYRFEKRAHMKINLNKKGQKQ